MVDKEGIKEKNPGILEAFGDRRFFISVTRGFLRIKQALTELEGEKHMAWVFYEAGKEYGRSIFEAESEEWKSKEDQEALKEFINRFCSLGFGVGKLKSFDQEGGRVVIEGKDLIEAWAVKRLGLSVSLPACDFTCGLVAGFYRSLSGNGELECIETSCQALGDESCTLEIVVEKGAKERKEKPIFAKEAIKELEESNARLNEALEVQQRFIRDLSTPVTEVWEGILVLPLIGTIDSERTMSIMEALLERIVATQSEITIMDLSGVPLVDTQVADSLIRTAEAAALLGARTFLSGISPKMAQTLAHLGVEMTNVETFASLREALDAAIQRIQSKKGGARRQSSIETLL
jgi:anti-anti-sigma regulatory factor/predicted hydrocarbon binding protein